jgi:RNA polymerase sigma-70 factor (ECF subfamily)
LDEATDAELVGKCRTGDREAWEVIVRRRHSRVYRLACRFTGRFDEAEDLTQEVFLKVYRTLHLYRAESGALDTWIVRVARNHFIDHYRKHKTERLQTDSLEDQREAAVAVTAGTVTPGQELERKEAASQVHRLLARLPDDQREAVILRDLEEYTYEEISGILDLPVGTVKSRINRGRIELARLARAGDL